MHTYMYIYTLYMYYIVIYICTIYSLQNMFIYVNMHGKKKDDFEYFSFPANHCFFLVNYSFVTWEPFFMLTIRTNYYLHQ